MSSRNSRLRRRECGLVRLHRSGGRLKSRAIRSKSPSDERRPPLHQRLVNLPEPSGRLGRVLRQLGGAGRVLVAGDRQVPKHVPHPLAEPAPQPLDDLVNRVTVRACIAAVLDQSHLCIGMPQERGRALCQPAGSSMFGLVSAMIGLSMSRTFSGKRFRKHVLASDRDPLGSYAKTTCNF